MIQARNRDFFAVNIVLRPKFQLEHLLKLGLVCVAGATAVVLLTWCLFYWLYPWKPESQYAPIGTRSQTQLTPLFSYESIGSGALALNPQQTYGWVSDIARELLVIAHNSRPDIPQRESHLLVALKHSKEQKNVLNGKTLFLDEGAAEVPFAFSDGPRALWIKPILLDNGGVLMEVGRKLGSLDAPHSEEKGQFVVQTTSPAARNLHKGTPQFAKALKSARGWGLDQLIQQYGGREFAEWKEKYKLDFVEGGQSYACFVSSGDRLVWEKERWRVAGSDESTAGLPLALVKSASSKGFEIDAWDESGFVPVHVSFPLEQTSKFMGKIEGMPSTLRLRTATQISCLLGKKRLILRQGDWLLKTANGWRILRRAQDIEQCLHHQLRGELLIFDGLEKEQGRWVFKGQVFDEMRTQRQPVKIPIDAEKKTSKVGRKRKLPFATKSVLPLWFSVQIGGDE